MPDMRTIFVATPETNERQAVSAPWREKLPCGHEGYVSSWPGGVSYSFCAICDLDWERRGKSGTWVTM